MFNTTKVKLDKGLVDRVQRYAELAGYSGPEEFITHALDPAAARLPDSLIRKHYERKHGKDAYYGQT